MCLNLFRVRAGQGHAALPFIRRAALPPLTALVPISVYLAMRAFVTAAFFVLIFFQAASADIYKYRDKNGVESFTDDPASIPEEYRKKALMVRKERPAASINSPTPTAEDTSEPKKKEWSDIVKEKLIENKDFYKTRAFEAIAAIAVFLVSFYFAGKAGAYLGMRQIATVIRIALMMGVLLYLFGSYLSGIVSSFTDLKDKAEGIKEQAEKRNGKIENAASEMFGK